MKASELGKIAAKANFAFPCPFEKNSDNYIEWCKGWHEQHEEAGTKPAFQVTYENNTSYVSSMAKGVTLTEARRYWLGEFIEQSNGKMLKIVAVEPI